MKIVRIKCCGECPFSDKECLAHKKLSKTYCDLLSMKVDDDFIDINCPLEDDVVGE